MTRHAHAKHPLLAASSSIAALSGAGDSLPARPNFTLSAFRRDMPQSSQARRRSPSKQRLPAADFP